MKRLLVSLGIVALAAVLAACSGGSSTPSAAPASAPTTGSGDSVTIVAKDIAFQPTSVTVKAGTPTTIVLDNQDSAPHNIKITDASGAEVFKGEIVTSTKVDNAVPALAAGTYTFICEVHPNMTGTITAS